MNRIQIQIATALLIIFSALQIHGQELTVYVIPPSGTLNWNSPKSLLLSYGANLVKKNMYPPYSHPLGHLIVELKDSSRYTIAGMVAQSRGEINSKFLFDGYGLGILFAPINGKLREGEENLNEITGRYANGDVRYINFKLNKDAFSRLWQYLEEYKAFGYDKIYNGENKPREGKGAGCSAFGTSFIDVAGLLPANEMSKWIVSAHVPDKLIGGVDSSSRWVSIPKILFKNKWADTLKHSYKTVTYYDPELVYNWILAAWNSNEANIPGNYRKELRGKAKGIVFDCRQYPLPGDPIWINNNKAPMDEPLVLSNLSVSH